MNYFQHLPMLIPNPQAELLTISSKGGRTLLVFDVTEQGVRVEYDEADLPEIIEGVRKYRQGEMAPL